MFCSWTIRGKRLTGMDWKRDLMIVCGSEGETHLSSLQGSPGEPDINRAKLGKYC